uniref:Uncharacterized protein n=1 Tax=Rhizophora mucronata TaxID=61149 RepID=A0A2P2IXV1_RHIMU
MTVGRGTPTPIPYSTILLNVNVVFRPALRPAITTPLTIDTRLLFSGTSCSYKKIKHEPNKIVNFNKHNPLHSFSANCKALEFHNRARLYIRL